MELLQNSRKTKRIFLFLSLSFFVACKLQNDESGNIGYGKEFYYSNCISCHNFKSSGFIGEISLYDMSNYDSSSLLMKIKRLKENEIHGNYLANKKFSDNEINSLVAYIKSYRQSPVKP